MQAEGDTGGRARLRVKIAADLAVWSVAGLVAFLFIALDGWNDASWTIVGVYTLIGLPIELGCILGFRLHRRTWRRFGFDDLPQLELAVITGTAVLFLLGLVAYYLFEVPLPRSAALIQGALALLAMGALRGAVRWRKERRWRRQMGPSSARAQRVLLVGAGDAGTRIAHEIRRSPRSGMQAVGFLDDNPAHAPLEIAGLRVLGRIDDLAEVVTDYEVEQVLITMPSAGGRATRRVVELARQVDVPCRILPGITQVLFGEVTLAGVRSVQVEDLLRREPVDLELASSYVRGRSVLVTGAGGSIGSELVRQVALLEPARVILFGHGENSLYDIGKELATTLPGLKAIPVIGDVRDRAKIDHVMYEYEPTVVFHAAAHKHVPMLEADPDEAVLNNVGGTKNLAEAALLAGVERFVNVSTDKAVRPVSVLGATKFLAERVVGKVAEDADAGQSFVSVRFGNVLGSRGSVVPMFQEQIRRGGPITVTDPEMTRYFMTIPEASRLVIQAGSLQENGALYVLDMGTPVRIVDLARDMIRLAGADEDDIEIVFTGRRAGEKLHEELFTDAEQLRATTVDQIVVARRGPGLDADAGQRIDDLLAAAEKRDWEVLQRCLGDLIPGFHPESPDRPGPNHRPPPMFGEAS
jgi:FlaA1/EpsC-like NDP-sugar epimerase